MRRDPRAYLWDVLDALRHVESFTAGASLDSYRESMLLRSAVERQLEIAGEALAQLRKVAPEIADGIPELRRIVAFRNMLVHGYAMIDHDTVWRTVQERVPELRAVVERTIAALGGET